MFNIGEVVFVGTKGICKIEDIKKNAFTGCDKSKEYYVLKPVESITDMVVFLPTDTPIKIRYLISKNQATEILKNIQNINFDKKLDDEEKYSICNQILKEVEINTRIMTLNFLMNKKLKTTKKTFGFQEQKTINTLLDCISQEIAFVLNKSTFEIKEQLLTHYQNK